MTDDPARIEVVYSSLDLSELRFFSFDVCLDRSRSQERFRFARPFRERIQAPFCARIESDRKCLTHR